MRVVSRFVSIFLFIIALSLSSPTSAEKITALPAGLRWLNTGEPVDLSKLTDRFVLVHFGIYSASNADSTIKDLKKLAQKYPHELAIIGIHAVKFFDQSALDNIRRTTGEQGINYPVAADEHLAAWKAYHIYALPTVILIAPDGEVVFRKSGDDVFRYLDKLLFKSIKKYEGSLSRRPLPAVIAPPQLVSSVDRMGNDDATEFEPKIGQIDVTQAEVFVESPAAVHIDFSEFVGEKIKVGCEYSRHIKNVTVTFEMPSQTHLLKSVKSYVRIFTKDGEQIGGSETPDPRVEIPVDQTIEGDRLFIETSFYYLRAGGLVQYKGLLFEVPLADYPKSENIELNYNLSSP